MAIMDRFDHAGGVRVIGLIETHIVPAILAPVHPVLHDDVERELLFAEDI